MFSKQLLKPHSLFLMARKSRHKNFDRCYSVTGDVVSPPLVAGIENLMSGRINKGMAFTLDERQV